jgi:hypothetical protein
MNYVLEKYIPFMVMRCRTTRENVPIGLPTSSKTILAFAFAIKLILVWLYSVDSGPNEGNTNKYTFASSSQSNLQACPHALKDTPMWFSLVVHLIVGFCGGAMYEFFLRDHLHCVFCALRFLCCVFGESAVFQRSSAISGASSFVLEPTHQSSAYKTRPPSGFSLGRD